MSEQVKHTPEPWIASKGTEDESERWVVCQDVDPERQYLVATVENGAPGDTLKTEGANARLIAAAPTLLRALRHMLCAYSDERGMYPEAFAMAEAAIAKATLTPNPAKED